MNKTISISGIGAITTDENGKGMSFEFWADEPEVQQVEAMRTTGTAQLMRSCSFFFTPSAPHHRANSTLLRKAAHGRLSATRDEAYQLTLKVFKREGLDVKETMTREAFELINNVKF